jgi:hypothetical protein
MSDEQLATWLDEEERKISVELENWLPRRGDRLFVSTPSAAVVDCTGSSAQGEERSPTGRHYLYADGYLLAADRIVESLKGLPSEDALIYPIFYLYRHHIELELKGAISLFLNWLYRGTPEERTKEVEELTQPQLHGIHTLWNKLKRLAPKELDEMGTETTEAFQSLVQQITDHDASGQAARYAFYRDGKQTFTRVNEVDLDNLRTQFRKMSHYVGAVREGIHQEINAEE